MPDNNSNYFEYLLQKYKNKGVIIDANLLIYYFIGSYDKRLLKTYKRTIEYKEIGYNLISEIINEFKNIFTTPHILTEVSNLSNNIYENIKAEYYEHFFNKIKILKEKYMPAIEIANRVGLKKFGLSDSMMINLVQEKPYLIITDDFPLYNYLISKKIDAINFSHLFDIYISKN